jgi:hypothetical protein
LNFGLWRGWLRCFADGRREIKPQPFNCRGVQLRNSRLMDTKHLTNALHAEFPPVVEIEHEPMPLRKAAHSMLEHGSHFSALEFDLRVVPHVPEQAPQSGLLRDQLEDCQVCPGLDEFDVPEALEPPRRAMILRVQPNGRRGGRRNPVSILDCRRVFLGKPLSLPCSAGKPIHGSRAIENGAPDPVFGVGLEQDAAGRIETFDRFEQPDHAVAHQVFELHRKSQPHAEGLRHKAHLRHVKQ